MFTEISSYFVSFLGGKSSVLLDIKPWDDETDMKKLEEAVRSVEMPGLLWGACKHHCSYFWLVIILIEYYFRITPLPPSALLILWLFLQLSLLLWDMALRSCKSWWLLLMILSRLTISSKIISLWSPAMSISKVVISPLSTRFNIICQGQNSCSCI